MWQLFAQVEGRGVQNTIDTLARTPISLIVYIAAIATVLRLAIYGATKNVAMHQRGAWWSIARIVNEGLDAIVYALIFVFLLIRPFGIQAFTIPSGSMVPTLQINDYIVANKAIYRYSNPKVGDIVVFKPPERGIPQDQKGRDIDYIKRVRGVPGDIVEIKDNILYRNGKPIDEPYIRFTRQVADTAFEDIPKSTAERWDFKLVYHKGDWWPVQYDESSVNPRGRVAAEFVPTSFEEAEELRKAKPAPIPKGFLLMMGDNRLNSFDSRGWGLVPRESVIGRAEFIWFPLGRWGPTR